MNSLHINRLEDAVHDIASNSRTVRTILNAVTEDVKGIHEIAMITPSLPALESAINSVLHINNLVIKNVVGVDRGRVVSSLFPVKDLQRVLMKGEKEHQLTLCLLRMPYTTTIPYWSRSLHRMLWSFISL